jgi:putative hydrolase of the HAD superfamily
MIVDQPRNVREAVLAVLSEEFPISSAALKKSIKNRFGMNVTFQAVHKELQALVQTGTLTKSENLYQFSLAWVNHRLDFFQRVSANLENRRRIRIVCFDLGGTIFRREVDNQIWNEFLPLLYAQENGMDLRSAKRFVYAEYYAAKYIEGVKDWTNIDMWFARLNIRGSGKLRAYLQGEPLLFEDVLSVLEVLSQDYKIVGLTTGDARIAELKLRAAGVRSYFYRIVSAERDLQVQRRDAQFYALLLKHLSVSAENVVHVGDEYETDFEAPTSVGIPSVLIDREGARNDGTRLTSLQDLPGRIRHQQ